MTTRGNCQDCGDNLRKRPGRGRPRKRCELCAPSKVPPAADPVVVARDRVCLACGGTFNNRTARVLTCSKVCGGRLNRARVHGVPLVVVPLAELAAYRRVQNALNCARKQTRRRIAFVEAVDPLVVFERDRWRCHLCGELVDRSLPRRSRKGATLDHMIPLAEGGAHSYANTALAHKSCNSAKGQRATVRGEQLALV